MVRGACVTLQANLPDDWVASKWKTCLRNEEIKITTKAKGFPAKADWLRKVFSLVSFSSVPVSHAPLLLPLTRYLLVCTYVCGCRSVLAVYVWARVCRLSTHLLPPLHLSLLSSQYYDRHPVACCDQSKLKWFCFVYAGVFKVNWQKRVHLYVPDMTGFEVLAQLE